jgi:hypothetical protein
MDDVQLTLERAPIDSRSKPSLRAYFCWCFAYRVSLCAGQVLVPKHLPMRSPACRQRNWRQEHDFIWRAVPAVLRYTPLGSDSVANLGPLCPVGNPCSPNMPCKPNLDGLAARANLTVKSCRGCKGVYRTSCMLLNLTETLENTSGRMCTHQCVQDISNTAPGEM